MQNQGYQQNRQKGPVTYNHGGHEVNDMHEVLTSMTGVIEQYAMFRDQIKDPELLTMLNNQCTFMEDEYNMLVQAFSTGQDPAHGTKRYQMSQSNESIIYGLKPTQPKTPKRSTSEFTDECYSGFMLGLMKSMASGKTMAAIEVANPVLRRVLQDSIPNCIEMCYEIAIWQNKKGFYQIAQYSQPDMQQLTQAFATIPNNQTGINTH